MTIPMKNGYTIASEEGLIEINEYLQTVEKNEYEILAESLNLGIQWQTQVTQKNKTHTITQVYCSALPIAYMDYDIHLWEAFAKLILNASYEATVCVGILNALKTGNNRIYFTLVGGGAFGNKIEWIVEAIKNTLNKYKDFDLDIVIVSYHSININVSNLIESF